MTSLQPGTLSPQGWTVNSVTTAWSRTFSSSTAYASGGFSSTYTPITTNGYTPPLNLVWTGFTDVIQGGSSSPLALVPQVGITIGANTILDLGPAATSAGNQLLGYGANCGVRIGQQSNPFAYGISSGAVYGGRFAKDSILGTSYNPGGAGIENYGEIKLFGGSDQIFGTNTASGGYGLINWGSIETGGITKFNDADTITGIGKLAGIQNYIDLATSSQLPRISTGAGDDVITGKAASGNYGIVNNGIIDMGAGNDICQSQILNSGNTGLFNGSSGNVIMGAGSDTVTGFGNGSFWGGGLGETAAAAQQGQAATDVDILNLIGGGTQYVITATSTTYAGNTIDGFAISNGGMTMNVYGFESFGSNAGDQQSLAAGTYTLA